MGLRFRWADRARRLAVELTPGSRMRPPLTREIAVRVAGSSRVTNVKFSGRPVTMTIPSSA
jgi:hypothetical protein